LDLGRKNAYARVEGIGGGIGNEATRVYQADWRRAVRLLKRLFQRLLILGLGILSIWLIVFVIFETADRRLPWLLALGLTYGIAAYIVLPRAIRIGLKILQRKLVPSFTITGDGLPADPVNLALIGTLPQLRTAFAALGWSEADRLSVASSWRMARAFLFNSPYPTAPFSTLYLFGRGQDIGFQKAIDNSPRKRHHIRFWALSLTCAQHTWGAAGFWLNTDRPPDNEHVLWVGAGTRDTGLSLTRLSFQITHATDSDTNAERDYVIAELMKNRVIEAVKVVQSGQRLPAERVNHYITDGEVTLASLLINDA
jgi:LssY C-terminus